ncbi:MAG: DNA mismatch repair protein MutS, partial [Alphaproteobacteria bacterium]|nr:DNA mismatch repair protein MutS [Alphaproteobacteria bacterium]
EIPMCGVPYHAYEMYLSRLIKLGFKVAIAEQTEDPKEAKKRKGASAIVRRDVVRLVTAGTLTEDTMLEAKKNNFIVSSYVREREIGLAWVDISTGAFFMQRIEVGKQASVDVLGTALSCFEPEEVLFEDRLLDKPEFIALFREYRDKLAMRSKSFYNYEGAVNTLLKAFGVKTMDSFGDFSKAELIAAGVLLSYVETTQKGKLPRMQMPKHIIGDDIMEIDSSTRRSLEILDTTSVGGASLLKVMDKTVTGVGGRLLSERLAMPLLDVNKINDRFDCVQFFIDNPMVRKEVREALRLCQDAERAVGRLSLERGSPRDLYDLAVTLKVVPRVKDAIIGFKAYQRDSIYQVAPSYLFELVNQFHNHSELVANICDVLIMDRESLPQVARNGGFIRDGAYAPLDYLKNIRVASEPKVEELRKLYVDLTGVTGLKIKNNSIIGYYVEVPTKNANPLLENKTFIHRQSVLNAVRFTTSDLMELEKEILSAEEEALKVELEIFEKLREFSLGQGDHIVRTAEIL